jgi:hypothetical protein
MPASGYRSSSGGALYYAGTYGYYWSSTCNDSGNPYALSFDSGYVNAGGGNDYKATGNAVRCVAEF